ncbi:MAG: nuclear transport factor 2 family protein [Longimicrobiaceae bacterium]
MTRRLPLPRAVVRLALLAAAILPVSAYAQEPRPAAPAMRPASDSAAVAATVERYHRSLASGDSAAALALLTTDAVILESGSAESRAEYRSHHLPADIEFARAVPSQRGPLRVKVQGDAAWATSTSTTQGQFRGRAVNSAGAELMVLTRTRDGWRIAAIHWSSRTRR